MATIYNDLVATKLTYLVATISTYLVATISTYLMATKSTYFVTTLALGSRPRQGLAKVWAKNEAQESHFMLPRV
jgi:hypothetical protein